MIPRMYQLARRIARQRPEPPEPRSPDDVLLWNLLRDTYSSSVLHVGPLTPRPMHWWYAMEEGHECTPACVSRHYARLATREAQLRTMISQLYRSPVLIDPEGTGKVRVE